MWGQVPQVLDPDGKVARRKGGRWHRGAGGDELRLGPHAFLADATIEGSHPVFPAHLERAVDDIPADQRPDLVEAGELPAIVHQGQAARAPERVEILMRAPGWRNVGAGDINS